MDSTNFISFGGRVKKVNLILAYDKNGIVVQKLTNDIIKSKDIIYFIKSVRNDIVKCDWKYRKLLIGKVYMYMDNASCHRSTIVKEYAKNVESIYYTLHLINLHITSASFTLV